jgi:hypothetical protein
MGGSSACDPAEVVRQVFELMEAHRPDDAAELYAETAVNHAVPLGERKWLRSFLIGGGFPR